VKNILLGIAISSSVMTAIGFNYKVERQWEAINILSADVGRLQLEVQKARNDSTVVDQPHDGQVYVWDMGTVSASKAIKLVLDHLNLEIIEEPEKAAEISLRKLKKGGDDGNRNTERRTEW
jgi:hypothetical protein